MSGLPFTATLYMSLILLSFLAHAQEKYPIKICHFVMMANHIHLVIYIENPEDVPAFMGLFKTDSATAVNKMRKKRKRSIWCESFSCLPILTLDNVVNTIAYTYVNPQAADLVDTIEEYPGLSSWQMYQKNIGSIEVPYIRRSHVFPVPSKLPIHKQETIVENLKAKADMTLPFTLSPDAWMETFGITDEDEKSAINKRILDRVRELEAQHRERRVREKKTCVGARKLMEEDMDKIYEPRKYTPNMWCISSCKEIRMEFIGLVKSLLKRAKEVRERWKLGDYRERYPIGLFSPSLPRTANLIASPV
jgi:REP element-mobilizing transposase RayT